jgi:hypothetical protein
MNKLVRATLGPYFRGWLLFTFVYFDSYGEVVVVLQIASTQGARFVVIRQMCNSECLFTLVDALDYAATF